MKNHNKVIRICSELVGKIERIREQQQEKTGVTLSYNDASLVLSRRIDNAGGLRE